MTASTHNRRCHHRGHHRLTTDSAGRAGGRSSQLAEAIRAAGADGIAPVDLAAAIGKTKGNLQSLLASMTPRYPQVYEDDGGRLYWAEVEP